MIAIAGAKGGSGTTTTTLGLAEAFGRAGTPTIALDADRGLPNLHVLADVDRTPTYAGLVEEASVTDVAHPHPRSSEVGILTAPEPSKPVGVESALAAVDDARFRVLVDCPSGAGPDVIEPLSAVSGVVVTTTTTDRSVEAARTTIDVARRLDTEVVGVVGTRCDVGPEALETRVGAPVLGTVPDREPPLEEPDVRTAFDEIAAELAGWRRARRAPVDVPGPTLRTGVDPIDDALGSGLPEGSIVTLTAEAASQSEQLLYALTAERGTLYLSTDRTAESLRYAIRSTPVEAGEPTVRRLEGDSLAEAEALVGKLPESATLVVDAVDALERAGRSRYVSFLTELEAAVRRTGSLAVLYGVDGPSPPANRAVTERIADVVFEFESPAQRRPTTWPTLAVSKFRFDAGFTDRIDLSGLFESGHNETVVGSR